MACPAEQVRTLLSGANYNRVQFSKVVAKAIRATSLRKQVRHWLEGDSGLRNRHCAGRRTTNRRQALTLHCSSTSSGAQWWAR